MAFGKRILLFIAINLLVILSITLILNLLHVQPYLTRTGINYYSLMIFCLIWGMGGAFISLLLSRVMAKALLGVKVIDIHTKDPTQQKLLSIVRNLTKSAHLPMPEVGIYESREINAFATGPTKKRALVAVSSGLLEKMSSEELEGVLSHEISHIANGDMVTMTLLQGVVNAFVMFLARILAFFLSNALSNKNSSSENRSYFMQRIFIFIFEIFFMVIGFIVIAWFSRRREYRADTGGADLAGKSKMIAALEALRRTINIQDPKAEVPALQAFKISESKSSRFLNLFATHPPLIDRIQRLSKL